MEINKMKNELFSRPTNQSESNKERVGFGPLLITVLFLALKKLVFLKKKFFPKKKKNFFLPFFYATFQCGRYNVFKKFFF